MGYCTPARAGGMPMVLSRKGMDMGKRESGELAVIFGIVY